MSEYKRLKELDFEHLWHPFTPSEVWFSEDPVIIEKAEGVELIDVHGRRYLDGVSSLWCNVHGHGRKEIVQAIQVQAARLCHSTLLGLSHRPALEFTEMLLGTFPEELSRVFYSDSGTAAVEAAIRMSIEYWQKQKDPAARKRKKLLSFSEAYHGDTLGAVGVGFSSSYHKALADSIIPAFRFHPPHVYRYFQGFPPEVAEEKSIADLQAILEKHAGDIAALIVEPLMQGAAGMWTHTPEYLRRVVKLCRDQEILIIADEVATGFGKSGEMYASALANVIPDFCVLGKGITGGYLPMSAVVVREEIFARFTGEVKDRKTFFFGQTYGGNPLACAAAIASLTLFLDEQFITGLQKRIDVFGELLNEYILPLSHVDEIRRLGVMTGIELTSVPGTRKPYKPEDLAGQRVVREARTRGVFLRPLGNVLTLVPPLCMKEEDLGRLVRITAKAISAALDEKPEVGQE